jgi:hypothetical protein
VHFGLLQRTLRIPAHNSLFLMSPNHGLRKVISAIVQHPLFDNIILLSILITSITLVVETPADSFIADACPSPPNLLNCSGLLPGQTESINCPRSPGDPDFGRVYEPCDSPNTSEIPACCSSANKIAAFAIIDYIFTAVFVTEMILKMVSDGLLLHKHAYLRNAWNLLDFAIVVISLLSLTGGNGNMKALKSLRTVRALRPLRVIKRNPGLKIAVVSLLSSVPAMMNVAIVVILWFSMYAMLSVQLFKGQFYRCQDLQQNTWYGSSWFPTGSMYTAAPPMSGPLSVPTIIECVNAGSNGGQGAWVDKPYTFNDYPRALLTLFEMATTEGWMDVMSATVDGVNVGVTPIPNMNPWWSLYCALHIVIGAFVLLNLIVGSVINNYNRYGVCGVSCVDLAISVPPASCCRACQFRSYMNLFLCAYMCIHVCVCMHTITCILY